MPKKNTGKLLERLVSIIESSLNDKSEFHVTHDIKLEDQFGNKRQIDVLIEYKASQRFDFKIGIECRAYKGKIKMEAIDAFYTKCQSLTIAQKIFVARSGFQTGAIKKAQSYGIKLYTLREINSERVTSWINTDNIFEIYVDYKLLKTTILLDEVNTNQLEKNQKLSEFYNSVHDKKLTIWELFSQYMKKTKRIFLDQQALHMHQYGPAVLNKRYQVEVEFDLEKEGIYSLVNEDLSSSP